MDDHEDLGSFGATCFAGAFAGVTEHCVMFPVDTLKTRMQVLSQPGACIHGVPPHLQVNQCRSHSRAAATHRSFLAAAVCALRADGIAGLYRGVAVAAAGAGPAHAAYFSTYELLKDRLSRATQRTASNPVVSSLAGAGAMIAHDAVMTPTDVVKQRLQMAHSPYRNALDCVLRTVAASGPQALFRSFSTTLLMNIPYTTVHISVYENCKAALRSDERSGVESLASNLVAGAAAGGVAAGVTTPLDVVKTRLQTDGTGGAVQRYTGSQWNLTTVVARDIVQEEGVGALLRGWKPRVLFHVPSAAICWASYEALKRLLLPTGAMPHDHNQTA
ncbi:unnamed protein product [Pedinophyceae sp. YPF-701]|nr:unnamed protein product [Pedinophyceae sp. YPF-701]